VGTEYYYPFNGMTTSNPLSPESDFETFNFLVHLTSNRWLGEIPTGDQKSGNQGVNSKNKPYSMKI